MMNVTQLQNIIIPQLNQFCGVPIIMADQTGDKPNGPHATFKFTTAEGKDVGHAEETTVQRATHLEIKRIESYKVVISITAYDFDDDISRELAQKIKNWFLFHGSDVLDYNGIVIVEHTNILNRDAFVIEDYERRNGFDVTMRITREMSRNVEWFEGITIDLEKGGNN